MKLFNFLAISQGLITLPQTIGFSNLLTAKPIHSPSFREYPLTALKLKGDSTNNESEWNDKIRNMGISEYGLTEDQINDPSFGWHTLDTMKKLKNRYLVKDYKEAFKKVKDLNKPQCEGILQHLTRVQVLNPNFKEHTIEALNFIKSKYHKIDEQEAYNIAIDLSPKQVKCLTDYGLSLNQVNTKRFKDSEDAILKKLIEIIDKKIGDPNLPLSKEQSDIAKKEFEKIFETIGNFSFPLSPEQHYNAKEALHRIFELEKGTVNENILEIIEGVRFPLSEEEKANAANKLNKIFKLEDNHASKAKCLEYLEKEDIKENTPSLETAPMPFENLDDLTIPANETDKKTQQFSTEKYTGNNHNETRTKKRKGKKQ